MEGRRPIRRLFAAIRAGIEGAWAWEVKMEAIRNDQLLEVFEEETGRNFERGVKVYFKILGLSNWKDRVAIYSDGKTTN